jgi:hypothetical protein
MTGNTRSRPFKQKDLLALSMKPKSPRAGHRRLKYKLPLPNRILYLHDRSDLDLSGSCPDVEPGLRLYGM